MNSAKLMRWKISLLLLLSFVFVGCGGRNGAQVRVAGRGAAVNQTGFGGVSTCSNSAQEGGRIYDASGTLDPNQFDQQVHNFVSATMDPHSLGFVSGDINATTGVDFRGSFQFDSQGNLVGASSSLLMRVFDQYVGTVMDGQVIMPYVVQFTSAADGFVDRNARKFTVRFSDSYGEIVFQGSYDNQMAQGVVTFSNASVAGGYGSAQQTLGDFQAYTCSLLK